MRFQVEGHDTLRLLTPAVLACLPPMQFYEFDQPELLLDRIGGPLLGQGEHAEGNRRPDRAVIVYSQRVREAYRDVPLVIGGIEASLRRIAHYDYWSDKVRRSCLPDSKADMLLFGNAERAVVEVAHRLAGGEKIQDIGDRIPVLLLNKGA